MSTLLLFATLVLAAPSAPGWQEDQPDSPAPSKPSEQNLEDLFQKLSAVTQSLDPADRESSLNGQQKRIQLADQILDHPETDERQRVFAALTKLQAFGIQFAIHYHEKIEDDQLVLDYADTIEEFLNDDDERIVLEATTAKASLTSGLFVDNPTAATAEKATEALLKLDALAPEDPLIQTTRRVLLERVWNSDRPELVLKPLAETGDEAAQIAWQQIETHQDRALADFSWARFFAKQRDFVAMRRLAQMYETGQGTRSNLAQSARWYTKLARLGDVTALIKLGDFLLAGKGYSPDAKAAAEYYQTAARANSRIAQFKLGECYRLGLGVEASDDNWRKWIKSAAFNATNREVRELYQAIDFKSAPDSFQIFYQTLLDQNPDDIFYLNNLAYSLLIGSNKDPQRSLKLVDLAIEIAPADFEGLASFQDTRAQALQQNEQWEEAAELFESIRDKVDDKRSVIESLIECYDHLDKEKADSYRRQLESLPDRTTENRSDQGDDGSADQ